MSGVRFLCWLAWFLIRSFIWIVALHFAYEFFKAHVAGPLAEKLTSLRRDR